MMNDNVKVKDFDFPTSHIAAYSIDPLRQRSLYTIKTESGCCSSNQHVRNGEYVGIFCGQTIRMRFSVYCGSLQYNEIQKHSIIRNTTILFKFYEIGLNEEKLGPDLFRFYL